MNVLSFQVSRMPFSRNKLSAAGLLISALLVVSAAACDKVPLLAPSGTVINLTVTSEIVALNSSIDVIAVLIENGTASGTGTGNTSTTGAGTPVQNGTVVSFTTTIGRIEPAEATTHNGRVTVKFISQGESGKATITAYSGGAKSTGSVTIGAAAVKLITATATPQNLPSSGGTTTVTARVEDTNGNGLVGVPVLFTTTKGTFSASTVNTNSSGLATTQLTTGGKAEVTATVGAVSGKVTIDVASRASITVTGPTGVTAISAPATFTVTVGTTQPLKSSSINFGDGQAKALGTGNTSVTHFYSSSGIYDVTVTGVDIDGESVYNTIQVAIVKLSATVSGPASVARGDVASFTVAILPDTAQINYYHWDFGDGTSVDSTGKTQNHVYATDPVAFPPGTSKTYTVTVTVVPLYGAAFDATFQIKVTS
jgi:hypothetical protein